VLVQPSEGQVAPTPGGGGGGGNNPLGQLLGG
jgi:hypothetical protein